MSRRRARRAAPRGRRRSGARGYSWTLPDWAWGGVLGALILVGVGVFFLFARGGSGSPGNCDRPLKPLLTSDLSAKGFQEEDQGLANVISLLNRNDGNGASAAFYGPIHNFTHNADPKIRAKDETLAKNLCQTVINLEDALVAKPPTPTSQLASLTIQIRQMIHEGAIKLGYASQ